MPSPLAVDIVAVFFIGLLRGADPSRIAAIGALTHRSFERQPRLSRFTGTLFAGGHSVMSLAIASLIGMAGASVASYRDGIAGAGAVLSIALLILIGSPWPAPRTRSGSNAFGAVAVGFLFGFGFETSSQVAAAALALDSGFGWATDLAIGAVFSLGLLLTDTLASVLVHRLVSGQPDVRPITTHLWTRSMTIAAFLVAGYELGQVLGVIPPEHDIAVTGAIVGAFLAVFAYIVVATRTGIGATRSHRTTPRGDKI